MHQDIPLWKSHHERTVMKFTINMIMKGARIAIRYKATFCENVLAGNALKMFRFAHWYPLVHSIADRF